jgi:hypothetical protein
VTLSDQLVFEAIGQVLARERVSEAAAVPILTAVYAELEKGDECDWLYLCRVDDVSGTPHVVVTREPPASARRMMRFKINLMRVEARKELATRYEHEMARAN